MSVIDWVTEKLKEDDNLKVINRTPENFLNIQHKDGYTFLVAVLGVQGLIERHEVERLFTEGSNPQLVVNVPSKTLWSGDAIRYIHAASAAFGSLGDISRAASTGDAGSYRNKNMDFFITSIQQHSNVTDVSYVYDNVFEVERKRGAHLTVAVIEAYNMSAEDVRNARKRFGHFDIVVKSTSYGSITEQAEETAKSIGAEALMFRNLMGRPGK